MISKKKLFQNWKLVVITDSAALEGRRDLEEVVRLAIAGGADVIQLRDKAATDAQMMRTAQTLLRVTRPAGIPLIINDRLGVAKDSGADGLHLGQADGSLVRARSLLGKRAIIGRSTHSPEQALEAQKEGADYIGVGPIFKTPTKPGLEPVGLRLVSFAAKNISIPFVAIGGIEASNVARVREAGARTVAVVRAVMSAEDPRNAAAQIRRALSEKDRK